MAGRSWRTTLETAEQSAKLERFVWWVYRALSGQRVEQFRDFVDDKLPLMGLLLHRIIQKEKRRQKVSAVPPGGRWFQSSDIKALASAKAEVRRRLKTNGFLVPRIR